MAAGTYNFILEQGTTFRRSITWKDSLGNPINLSGYTARMKIKDKKGGTTILTLTTENGGITLGGALGTIQLYITAAQTAAVAVGKGVYDLELADSSATPEVVRLLEGKVTISKEVTT